jgi:hypothetical protein
VSTFDVSLYEPIDAVVTADNTAYTADNATWPTADGGLLEGATDLVAAAVGVDADVLEAAGAVDELDAAVIPAGVAIIAEAADAVDELDARRIRLPGFGGVVVRPPAVVGVGYGILPELEGSAHGVVGVAGTGDVTLQLTGTAEGEVEDEDELLALMILLAA